MGRGVTRRAGSWAALRRDSVLRCHHRVKCGEDWVESSQGHLVPGPGGYLPCLLGCTSLPGWFWLPRQPRAQAPSLQWAPLQLGWGRTVI